MSRNRGITNDFLMSRADKILKNSDRINQQRKLKEDQEKVQLWLDNGNGSQVRRSNRSRIEPSWHKLFDSTSKIKSKVRYIAVRIFDPKMEIVCMLLGTL
jgi:hypothetical protein